MYPESLSPRIPAEHGPIPPLSVPPASAANPIPAGLFDRAHANAAELQNDEREIRELYIQITAYGALEFTNKFLDIIEEQSLPLTEPQQEALSRIKETALRHSDSRSLESFIKVPAEMEKLIIGFMDVTPPEQAHLLRQELYVSTPGELIKLNDYFDRLNVSHPATSSIEFTTPANEYLMRVMESLKSSSNPLSSNQKHFLGQLDRLLPIGLRDRGKLLPLQGNLINLVASTKPENRAALLTLLDTNTPKELKYLILFLHPEKISSSYDLLALASPKLIYDIVGRGSNNLSDHQNFHLNHIAAEKYVRGDIPGCLELSRPPYPPLYYAARTAHFMGAGDVKRAIQNALSLERPDVALLALSNFLGKIEDTSLYLNLASGVLGELAFFREASLETLALESESTPEDPPYFSPSPNTLEFYTRLNNTLSHLEDELKDPVNNLQAHLENFRFKEAVEMVYDNEPCLPLHLAFREKVLSSGSIHTLAHAVMYLNKYGADEQLISRQLDLNERYLFDTRSAFKEKIYELICQKTGDRTSFTAHMIKSGNEIDYELAVMLVGIGEPFLARRYIEHTPDMNVKQRTLATLDEITPETNTNTYYSSKALEYMRSGDVRKAAQNILAVQDPNIPLYSTLEYLGTIEDPNLYLKLVDELLVELDFCRVASPEELVDYAQMYPEEPPIYKSTSEAPAVDYAATCDALEKTYSNLYAYLNQVDEPNLHTFFANHNYGEALDIAYRSEPSFTLHRAVMDHILNTNNVQELTQAVIFLNKYRSDKELSSMRLDISQAYLFHARTLFKEKIYDLLSQQTGEKQSLSTLKAEESLDADVILARMLANTGQIELARLLIDSTPDFDAKKRGTEILDAISPETSPNREIENDTPFP